MAVVVELIVVPLMGVVLVAKVAVVVAAPMGQEQ